MRRTGSHIKEINKREYQRSVGLYVRHAKMVGMMAQQSTSKRSSYVHPKQS